jgi:hypothetical protein
MRFACWITKTTNTQKMWKLLLLHGKNGYAIAPLCNICTMVYIGCLILSKTVLLLLGGWINIAKKKNFIFQGRAMAQAVSRHSRTAEICVRTPFIPYEIYKEQSDTWKTFFPAYVCLPLSTSLYQDSIRILILLVHYNCHKDKRAKPGVLPTKASKNKLS